jgi:hypothetical protein
VHAISAVLVDLVKKIDVLHVGVAIKNQRVPVGMGATPTMPARER